MLEDFKDLFSIEGAGNHGPSAVQGSIIEVHCSIAVVILELTHTSHHIINIEATNNVTLNEKIPMLQKSTKFVGDVLTY